MAQAKTTTTRTNTTPDTAPQTDEEKAATASTEQTPTPAPTTGEARTGDAQSDGVDYAALAAEAARDARDADPGTEDVVLGKDVGGHRAGATITVTRGSAEYLRDQGYLDED